MLRLLYSADSPTFVKVCVTAYAPTVYKFLLYNEDRNMCASDPVTQEKEVDLS